jgi:fatty acid desaturase
VTKQTTREPSNTETDAADQAADWRDRASLGWIGLCALLAGVALRFSGLGAIGSWLSYALWVMAAGLILVGWSRRRVVRRRSDAMESGKPPPET